jgi:aminoglycoside 3-N-acetyltransferase
VHSSLAALGPLRGLAADGIPALVLGALRRRLGPSGDLVMPAFGYDFPATGRCDLRTAPSAVGVLTENFRTCPGVLRSTHPMFSFTAEGPGATDLLHPETPERQPFGPESVLARLAARNALVLLLGAEFRYLTSFVYSERENGVRYRFDKPFAGQVTGIDGAVHHGEFRHFCLPKSGELHPDYSRAKAELLASGLAERRVAGLGAVAWFRLGPVHDFLGRRLKDDPWYLLAQRPVRLYRFENGQEIATALP